MKKEHRAWGERERALFVRHWPRECVGTSREERTARRLALAARLGRTVLALTRMATKLGVHREATEATRNHRRPWSPEDNATLRKVWGKKSERALRELFGRTTPAIGDHAVALGLPPQSTVTRGASIRRAMNRLGLSRAPFLAFLRECGVMAHMQAPVWRVRPSRHVRVVDIDQVEAFFLARESRTSTLSEYERTAGIGESTMRARMARFALDRPGTNPRYVPLGVLDEVRAGTPGRWCALWQAVCARPVKKRHAAPWLLALAVDELARAAEGDATARDLIDWLPVRPQRAAEEIDRALRGVAPKPRQKRRAKGPTLVRAAGAARCDGRAPSPAAPTSTGNEPELERRSA